jgi:hypothetical protein
MMNHISVVRRYSRDEREYLFESLEESVVCLSSRHPSDDGADIAIACGEVLYCNEEGVMLWHIGEKTFVQWDEFDTVEVFKDDEKV